MKRIKAFIKRYLLIERNYKLLSIITIISFSINLLIFFMIDKYFKTRIEKFINTDYFSYIFITFIIFNFSQGNQTINQIISFDINSQTFERFTTSKKILHSYLISLIIYSFLISLFYTIFSIILIKISGINIQFKPDISALLLIIFISSLSFSAISIISSSILVIFKKGDLFGFFLSFFEAFFGGIYFPIDILGSKWQLISNLLPITYSISAVYKISYSQATLSDIQPEVKMLLLFTILLLPSSFYLFNTAVYISKRSGNTTQF